jgi:hypothetical protein
MLTIIEKAEEVVEVEEAEEVEAEVVELHRFIDKVRTHVGKQTFTFE